MRRTTMQKLFGAILVMTALLTMNNHAQTTDADPKKPAPMPSAPSVPGWTQLLLKLAGTWPCC